jgi:hypothetical protein
MPEKTCTIFATNILDDMNLKRKQPQNKPTITNMHKEFFFLEFTTRNFSDSALNPQEKDWTQSSNLTVIAF